MADRRRTEQARRPLLITGAHRSGSTWVGRTLAKAPGIGYVHEPFSLGRRPGTCSMPVERWYQYVTDDNDGPYAAPMERTLRFSYAVGAELSALRSVRDAARMARDWSRFLYHRLRGDRPLIKDPIAFFSAAWLADRFDMEVVVLIRHPAAFVGSLKRLNWTHDFRQFLDQPLLMRDHLAPFEAEIRAFVEQPHGIIDQATLLWKLIYHVAARYREVRPDWQFVRHEDLSRAPLAAYRALFEALRVPFTPAVEAYVRESTDARNPGEVPAGTVHLLQRDSRANIWTWKQRLTPAEIDRIRRGVAPVADLFYDEDDW